MAYIQIIIGTSIEFKNSDYEKTEKLEERFKNNKEILEENNLTLKIGTDEECGITKFFIGKEVDNTTLYQTETTVYDLDVLKLEKKELIDKTVDDIKKIIEEEFKEITIKQGLILNRYD